MKPGIEASAADDAAEVAALFCIDPAGLGGVVLRARAGAARDAWLDMVRALLPGDPPMRRVPLNVDDDRLLGGLDLAATLSTGRPVLRHGLLAEADGGVLLLCMAERIGAGTAARIAAAIDMQGMRIARNADSDWQATRFGVIALDEGIDEDEALPAPLRDRLAIHFEPELAASGVSGSLGSAASPASPAWTRDAVSDARARLARVRLPDALRAALCAAAMALGVDSLRGSLLALRFARASAALHGRDEVLEEDAAAAVRWVLAPRATTFPDCSAEPAPKPAPGETPPEEGTPREAEGEPEQAEQADHTEPQPVQDEPETTITEAATALIPAGLLDRLRTGQAGDAQRRSVGRRGAPLHAALRGRPNGARRGDPGAHARLDLIGTVRAAAPWQAWRRAAAAEQAPTRLQIRREDFHVGRFKQRSESTTVFVVDASGSAALHRLAEAKGAVELLLADCYVRRDSVALIAFRGHNAELLLPPTRSLARAKRCLAGLPGGGGTPLAAGIDAAALLGESIRRRGPTPVVVLLTDGHANVAVDGSHGRRAAGEDALRSARRIRARGFTALFLDTSPQPQASARELAREMGASYLPLPRADAAGISHAVRGPGGTSRSARRPEAA